MKISNHNTGKINELSAKDCLTTWGGTAADADPLNPLKDLNTFTVVIEDVVIY